MALRIRGKRTYWEFGINLIPVTVRITHYYEHPNLAVISSHIHICSLWDNHPYSLKEEGKDLSIDTNISPWLARSFLILIAPVGLYMWSSVLRNSARQQQQSSSLPAASKPRRADPCTTEALSPSSPHASPPPSAGSWTSWFCSRSQLWASWSLPSLDWAPWRLW